MRKMKAIISALFLIVVAINMMWSFTIKSFAANESSQQNNEPSDTGQSVEETSENTTKTGDKAKHSIIFFVDYVFWKAIEEAVRNYVKDLFQRIKNSKFFRKHRARSKYKRKNKHKRKK